MDEIYATDLLTLKEMLQFERWLDKEIGTEIERNGDEEDGYYLMIFDLTFGEVKQIRRYENENYN